MESKSFWFISLCTLLIISAHTGLILPLRIAIAANAVVILLDVAKQARRLFHERNETKD